MAKLQIFNREIGKVSGFLMACRPHIQMKMSGTLVEEQIQWVLSYIQGELVDIWKKNVIEDLESGNIKYVLVRDFLADLKMEFRRGLVE